MHIYKKLKYVPKNIENTQIKTDMISILENCLVSRKAIAPGAIIKPTAKIDPWRKSYYYCNKLSKAIRVQNIHF